MSHASRISRSVVGIVTLAISFGIGGAACARSELQISDAKPVAVKEHPKSSLRDQLAAHRHEQIARLHAYAEAGIFPRNLWSPEPLHQLKDPDGRLCAVANLVHLDGHDDVIDAMSLEHNDVLIGDEKSGPLHDWVLTSGLTAEEIGRIQEAALYMPDPAAEQQANVASKKHFAKMEAELTANEQASLDVAVARLDASDTKTASR
jgi:hypothetical protein